MLYSQSGLDQFLTVETLDLYCVSEAYPVPGVGSPVLAGERNYSDHLGYLTIGCRQSGFGR